MRIRRRFILVIGIFSALTFFVLGPELIHLIYRVFTPDSVMLEKRSQYSWMAETESTLSGAKKIQIQKDRYKLFLWFHARGFPIDEGDESLPFWQPWKDLIDHWRGDDGSRFFTQA
jgi:hypothetical protein